MTGPAEDGGIEGEQELTPPYASRHFSAYLEHHDLAILDVRHGTAPDSRRLLLGRQDANDVRRVVAVTQSRARPNAVDNEETVLEHATQTLRPQTRRSLPKTLERVEVFTALEGLAMSAPPGLTVTGRRWTNLRARELLGAMPRWFAAVWEDTAGEPAPVDLGASDVEAVLRQHQHIPRLEPGMDAIRRARERIAQYDIPQTLTHGCLCPRHVIAVGETVGVDDWGIGSVAGDPLRDLGRMAVHISGGRLPEVLAGRSGFAGEIRQFMTKGLFHTPVPAQLWREVVVLAQFELAMESLERADPNGMQLLGRALRLSRVLTRTR